MCFIAYLQPKNALFRLLSITCINSSAEVSSTLLLSEIAALLTTTSTFPYLLTTKSKSSDTSFSAVMSVFLNIDIPPMSRISDTVSFPPSLGFAILSATITTAPSFAKDMDAAFPIPELPPVTITTLSFIFMV